MKTRKSLTFFLFAVILFWFMPITILAEAVEISGGPKTNFSGFYTIKSIQEYKFDKSFIELWVISDDAKKDEFILVYRDGYTERFDKGDKIKIKFSYDGMAWVATFWKSDSDWVCCFEMRYSRYIPSPIK